jgi:UrcA family protein
MRAQTCVGWLGCRGLWIGALAFASCVLADDLQEVTVTATRPGLAAVAKTVEGRSPTTGAPIEQLTLAWTVAHSDLDLRQHADVMELQRRIHSRAKAVCDELDRLLPLTPHGGPECAKKAADGALAQADKLIAAVSVSKE